MNFLAHFHLACDDEGLSLGAFLGDFVKGPINSQSFRQQLNINTLPVNTLAGIMLHRKIDQHFDQLPQLKILEATLPKQCLRIKGILYDLFFDYALSTHWNLHHYRPLKNFEENTINLLDRYFDHFNQPASQLFQRMRDHQLLQRYHEKKLINAIINGIGKRLRLEKQLTAATQCMWENEALWLDCFHACYPALVDFSVSQQQQLIKTYRPSAEQQNL
jgi:acyl carrier protein phosphodiesterase